MTPGPWKWFTSNSMKRLSSEATGKDGDVISAYVARDGVPCVSVKEEDMAVLEAAPELLEALEWALTKVRFIGSGPSLIKLDKARALIEKAKRRSL